MSSGTPSPTQKTNQPTFMDRNFLRLIESCVYPICLSICICCQRFHVPLAFLFFRQSCRLQHPNFSFSKCYFPPTHSCIFSSITWRLSSVRKNTVFPQFHTWWGSLLDCGPADTDRCLGMTCLSSKLRFGQLTL